MLGGETQKVCLGICEDYFVDCGYGTNECILTYSNLVCVDL